MGGGSRNEWLDLADAWRNDRRLAERGGDRFDGLQAVTGDAQHDLVVRAKVARLGQRERGRDRRAAGSLGEDPGRFGEQPNPAHECLVADRGSPSACLAQRRA